MYEYWSHIVKTYPLLFGALLAALTSGCFLLCGSWLKYRYDHRIRRAAQREEAIAAHTANIQAMIEWNAQTYDTLLTLRRITGSIAGTKSKMEDPKDRQDFMKYTMEHWAREQAQFNFTNEKFINAKCEAIKALLPFDIYFGDNKEYGKLCAALFPIKNEPPNFFEEVNDASTYDSAKQKYEAFKKEKLKNHNTSPFLAPANALQEFILKHKRKWLRGGRHLQSWNPLRKFVN